MVMVMGSKDLILFNEDIFNLVGGWGFGDSRFTWASG